MTVRHPAPILRNPRQAADHLALVVDPRLYASHSLLVVACAADSTPLINLEIVDCSRDPSPSECALVLDNVVLTLAEAQSMPAGLVLALTRPGSDAIQSVDRTWFRAFHRVCHARRVVGHGVYVVGSHGARAIHIDDAA